MGQRAELHLVLLVSAGKHFSSVTQVCCDQVPEEERQQWDVIVNIYSKGLSKNIPHATRVAYQRLPCVPPRCYTLDMVNMTMQLGGDLDALALNHQELGL